MVTLYNLIFLLQDNIAYSIHPIERTFDNDNKSKRQERAKKIQKVNFHQCLRQSNRIQSKCDAKISYLYREKI